MCVCVCVCVCVWIDITKILDVYARMYVCMYVCNCNPGKKIFPLIDYFRTLK